jgi:nuclear pore complex protein Nup62
LNCSIYFISLFCQVDKALQSIEEEAERIYKDERGSLLDDEAASTRDAM